MDKVHEFVGNLLVEKGITDIEDDVRQHLIEDMTDLLMQQINNAAIRALPEEKAIELAEKLDNGSIKSEDIAQYMTDNGVNLEEIAVITMVRFRDLYLGNTVVDDQPENEENTPAEKSEN